MRIAYNVFNEITLLDFIGIYDPICRLKSLNYLPNLSWEICSFTETIKDSFGLELKPNKVKNSLSEYDAIIIPGGFGTRELQYNVEFINWIKTAEKTKYKISICTGSLILGASGFLNGKKATTNYQEYENLKKYCAEVVEDRIVEDGNVITSGAVSASIDLGLYLCEKWSGEKAKNEIRKKMDYKG